MTTSHVVSGPKPMLLILSGMHGDEYEVIDCVKEYLSDHTKDLPSYVYVPEVSPSAVTAQTRRNVHNHDINREFLETPRDGEVNAVIELLTPYHFTLALNFHEDPDLASTFYLYDSGMLTPSQLLALRSSVIEAGAGLHTGSDDPLDADLGLHVEKGYISTPYDTLPQDAGFAGGWMQRHGIIKRDIVIEIPGKASRALKQALVGVVFTFFLTPAFGF